MPPLLIGIGHSDRGDDHVGIEVVHRVRATGRDVEALAWSAPPLLLLDRWGDRDVVLVDAMRSGRPPGSVATLDEAAITSSTWSVSTHDIGIAQAFVLARTLGLGPATLHVVGIELGSHHHTRRMTHEVLEAVDTAVEHVLACLDQLDGADGTVPRDAATPS